MTIRNHVHQEFCIPRSQHLKPIHGDLLVGLGSFAEEVRSKTPAELLLSLVLIEGYSYGGQTSWNLAARSAHKGDEREPIFGSVRIDDDRGAGIPPERALRAAEDWIKGSGATDFVRGEIYPLPVPDDMKTSAVAGLLLVRAADVNNPQA